jgi:hypothetical protein
MEVKGASRDKTDMALCSTERTLSMRVESLQKAGGMKSSKEIQNFKFSFFQDTVSEIYLVSTPHFVL